MAETSKVIVYYTNGKKEDVIFDKTKESLLQFLQRLVGGYITLLKSSNGNNIYCDEDGDLKKLPNNSFAPNLLGRKLNGILVECDPKLDPDEDETEDDE